MASPFAFFRKNQRAWMVGLTIVTLIAFIIVPSIDSYVRPTGQQGYQDRETQVSWKGGRITGDQLGKLYRVHSMTYRVFSELSREVIRAGGMPKVPGFFAGTQSIGIDVPYNSRTVTDLRILANAAKQHGIILDDTVVEEFIRNYSDNKVSPNRLMEIRREVTGDSLSKFDMYDFLRDQIAGQILFQIGQTGVATSGRSLVTPSKNWTNFQKFQQRVNIEFYPLLVDQFLEKVTVKPSDQELRNLYSQAKDRLPNPDSPEPGFRRPYRTNVEFLVADLKNFLAEEEAKISEDELKSTYEKRVATEGAFKVPVEETPPENPPPDQKESEKPAEPASDNTKPNETEPTIPKLDSESEKPEQVPSKPAEEPAREPTNSPDAPDASWLPTKSRSKSRLVVFQNEDATKPVEADPSEEKSNETKPDETKLNETVQNTSETPTSENSPATKAEISTDAEAIKRSDSETDKSASAVSNTVPADETKPLEKPMRTQTFEEVRQSIRRDLAMAPAQKKMEEARNAAQEILDEYYNQLQLFNSADPNNPDTTKPSLPSLPKLGDKFGLTYGKTGLIDPYSMRNLSIGKTIVFSDFSQPSDMISIVFNDQVKLYQPVRSMGMNDERFRQEYVLWKIEEAPMRSPPFDEVRDEVEKAWKLQEARKLALKSAEEMVSSINASSESNPWLELVETNMQAEIRRPPAFTWMQSAMTQNASNQLSTVQGIYQPGMSFMEKAFKTPIGKAAATFDFAQQKCFVIRVLERSPSDDELRTVFERAPFHQGISTLADEQTQSTLISWQTQLFEELKVDRSNLELGQVNFED